MLIVEVFWSEKKGRELRTLETIFNKEEKIFFDLAPSIGKKVTRKVEIDLKLFDLFEKKSFQFEEF